MLSFLLASLLGAGLGFASGLVPGFHVNNLALLLLWASDGAGLDPFALSLVVVSAGIAHAFSGFIPSIFLGAPSEETALAISPGHRMLLSGKGYQALALCVTGSAFGIFAVLPGFFLLEKYALPIYSWLHEYLGPLLVLVSILMLFVEKRRAWALAIFLLSGIFGIVSLNSGINGRFVLLPILSGLFGASTLLLSLKNAPKIPLQTMKANIKLKDVVHGGTAGFLGGVLAGFLPGVGASQSAIIAQKATGLRGRRKFMMAIGAIGASDVLLSVFALSFIGRTRSGIAAAVETLSGAIDGENMLIFLGAGLFAAGIAAIATLRAGRFFAKNTRLWDIRKTSFAVLAFLFILSAMFTGTLGVLVFCTGTAIGILPHVAGTKKSLLISCLLLPTMLYFLGIDGAVLGVMGL